MLNGFFDIDDRLKELTKNGDPLARLNELIDWEYFRPELKRLRIKFRKSSAGRKPYDEVLMFKILILQSLYNLSDDSLEYQIMDRLSFMRFLGLDIDSKVPDAKTIWLFRDQLIKENLDRRLFDRFNNFLASKDLYAKGGQIVDASIVSARKPKNTRNENAQIKKGEKPENWSDNKSRQKETDATWLKKNGVNHFGFKNHISVDSELKTILDYHVSTASLHDSQMLTMVLSEDTESKKVWADSAYFSKEIEETLESFGFISCIQRKGCRYKVLSKWERQLNHFHSITRSRVEHVFGAQLMKAGNLMIRSVGLVRATVKIGLRNLTYNLNRYCQLVAMKA